VLANPTVAVSPSQSQSVQAGTTVSYMVSVTSRDNSGCAPSTFSLQASVPAGWTAALGSSSITLNPGATGSTTLQVASPASTPVRSYTMDTSATNSGAASYTGSGSAIQVIGSSLSLTVATDRPSYTRNQIVWITAVETSGGSPVANAAVTFTVTKADGAVVTKTATTSGSGAVVYKMRIGPKDPTGAYQVRANGSSGGTTATATTSFMVQ